MPSASAVHIAAPIHNRIVTVVSGQPDISKW
jgi:hypothetical protein